MELYKNVTKSLLAPKTPRRLHVEPGMVIDISQFGDITGTDIAMFINVGALRPVKQQETKNTEKKDNVRPVPSVTGSESKTDAVVENGTVVIKNSNADEDLEPMTTELGRVHKSGSAAAVVSAPQDTLSTMNPQQTPTKGTAFNELPDDVKAAVNKVEKMIAASNDKAPVVAKKSAKKTVKKASKKRSVKKA